MKQLSVLVLCTMLLMACQSKSGNEVSADMVNNPLTAEGDTSLKDLPKLVLAETQFDFGTILQGQKVTHVFKFTNAGTADLIISKAGATCGCTVPEYPKAPVKPGQSGMITVTFDSEGKTGMQDKTVTLLANTIPNTTTIKITANVKVE